MARVSVFLDTIRLWWTFIGINWGLSVIGFHEKKSKTNDSNVQLYHFFREKNAIKMYT